MDSTKKIVKKLAGHSTGTAAWATNVANERGRILMSVPTASDGVGLQSTGIALTQKSCIFTQKKSKKCIFKILMLPGTQDAYLYLIILF